MKESILEELEIQDIFEDNPKPLENLTYTKLKKLDSEIQDFISRSWGEQFKNKYF